MGGSGGMTTNAFVNPLEDAISQSTMAMTTLINNHDLSNSDLLYKHDYDMQQLSDSYMKDMSNIAGATYQKFMADKGMKTSFTLSDVDQTRNMLASSMSMMASRTQQQADLLNAHTAGMQATLAQQNADRNYELQQQQQKLAQQSQDWQKQYQTAQMERQDQQQQITLAQAVQNGTMTEEQARQFGYTPVADTNTVDFIKSKEGFRSEAYLDSAGIPTIGY